MTDDALPASLSLNAADVAASGLKALASLVDVAAPGLGSVMAELVSEIIPGQRNERLAAYIARVAKRVRELTAGVGYMEERLRKIEDELANEDVVALVQKLRTLTSEKIALFEDGARSAVRATTDQRINEIVNVVATGLINDDAAARRNRHLMNLLDQLLDDDVIRLCSYSKEYRNDREWIERHKDFLRPGERYVRAPGGGPMTLSEEHGMLEMQLKKLISLGLVDQDKNYEVKSGPNIGRSLNTSRKVDVDIKERVGIAYLTRAGHSLPNVIGLTTEKPNL